MISRSNPTVNILYGVEDKVNVIIGPTDEIGLYSLTSLVRYLFI